MQIVLTSSTPSGIRWRSVLDEAGAEVLTLPLVQTGPKHDSTQLQNVLAELGSYEWIVFTSTSGVKHFMDLLLRAYKDIRSFGPMRAACIGEGTAAALEKYHLQTELIPEKPTSKALAEALIETASLDSAKVLVITGNLNNPSLPKTLETDGRAIVDVLQVYATTLNVLPKEDAAAQQFRQQGAQAILFASPSAVEAFTRQKPETLELSDRAQTPTFVAVGQTTAAALKTRGFPHKLLNEPSPKALAELLNA